MLRSQPAHSLRATFLRAAALALICAGGWAAPAQARPVNVVVMGDSIANDLGRGMEDFYRGHSNVRIFKQTRFATGLVRDDYYDWDAKARNFLGQYNPDVIVVVIGGNDHQPIRTDKGRLDPFSKPWLAEYEKRVATFMVPFKKERAKVYWVGLPAVRSPSLSRSYQVMNAIYRRQAERHGFTYLSIWKNFLSHDGAYSSFGQSLDGVKRQLRESDGMHFTEAGRLRLAAQVGRAMGLR